MSNFLCNVLLDTWWCIEVKLLAVFFNGNTKWHFESATCNPIQISDSIAWNHKYTHVLVACPVSTVTVWLGSIWWHPLLWPTFTVDFSIADSTWLVYFVGLQLSIEFPNVMYKYWKCSNLFLVCWFISSIYYCVTKNGHTLLDMLKYFFAIDRRVD